LQTEVSALIKQFIQDEKTGLVTVTKIDTSADMSNSKVWVSVLGSRIPPLKVIHKIKQKRILIQRTIWHKMAVKNVPTLNFFLDENPAYAEHIEKILNEIKKSNN